MNMTQIKISPAADWFQPWLSRASKILATSRVNVLCSTAQYFAGPEVLGLISWKLPSFWPQWKPLPILITLAYHICNLLSWTNACTIKPLTLPYVSDCDDYRISALSGLLSIMWRCGSGNENCNKKIDDWEEGLISGKWYQEGRRRTEVGWEGRNLSMSAQITFW